MPEIKFKHIVSFSSEDKVYKAENLLRPETFRKWKCGTPGEKQASVVIQLEKSSVIHSIDIGNENSAFVEVLVGRSVDMSQDFKVLLVASSFMSPMESKNGNSVNRVRMFSPDKLTSPVSSEKWDLIKVVCTQPFNKIVQYGLSFIKLHSPPSSIEKNESTSVKKLGTFSIKESDDDELTTGNWFAKRKANQSPVSTAAEIRDAATLATVVLEQSAKLSKCLSPNLRATPKQNDVSTLTNQTEVKEKLDKNQHSSSFTKAALSNKMMPSLKRKGDETDLKTKVPPVKKSKSSPNTKPFNKLMEKVVFVLSGFKNPYRAELRDKAVKLGAYYKGDWDKSCTHLICAFLHTPKYDQVIKAGGRIVTKDWILDCYDKKSLLPWRDYMLGKYQRDSSTDESDVETDRKPLQNKDVKKKIESTSKPQNRLDTVANAKETNKSHESSSKGMLQSQVGNSEAVGNAKTMNKSDISMADGELQSTAESDEEYAASTDFDETGLSGSDSGEDTEGELRKAHHIIEATKLSPHKSDQRKPDTSELPLPELPEFFKNKCFYLYGNFNSEEIHNLERYIIAFHGSLSRYMDDKVNFVVTNESWDDSFNEALEENDNLIFVKPQWIYECKDKAKQIPFQRFVVVPSC